MSRHQSEFVIHLQHTVGVFYHAMFIRTFYVFHIVATKYEGKPLSTDCALRPASTIALSALAWDMTEVKMNSEFSHSPLIDPLAVLVKNAAIVGIHEGVGTALQFVVNA